MLDAIYAALDDDSECPIPPEDILVPARLTDALVALGTRTP